MEKPLPSHIIPEDLLDDLACRFMIVPNEEGEETRDYLINKCFQVELAYWFYLDMLQPQHSELGKVSIENFAAQMFQHLPSLWKCNARDALKRWNDYKSAIPVYGAIILNEKMNRVLLVQGFDNNGDKAGRWSFPKGKVNEAELPHECAVREALEETGCDVGEIINKEEYIERVFKDKTVRLYVVSGVSEASTKLQTSTRGEISDIKWWDVDMIPTWWNDRTKEQRPDVFRNAIPFMKELKTWITTNSGQLTVSEKSLKKEPNNGLSSPRTDPCVILSESEFEHATEEYSDTGWRNASTMKRQIY